MAVEALEAGKHVVVEKPMCLSVQEAERMISTAKERDRVLSIHQNRRWDKDFQTVRDLVENGTVGKPISIQSRFSAGPYLKPGGWGVNKGSTGGGPFLSMGPHLIDQILTMAPRGPIGVFGIVRSILYEDDYFYSVLTFEDEFFAALEMSRAGQLHTLPRWYVVGDGGDILISYAQAGSSSGVAAFDVRIRKMDGAQESFQIESYDSSSLYRKSDGFYENIYESITENKPLAVTPEDGRRFVAVAEAIVSSSEKHEVASFG
jgi:predicted dehydrogenase